jgi:mRNA interferase MazF
VGVVTTTAPPRRGEVHLVALDPTMGSEIRKTRPCVIVSPDELNLYLRTAIIAPMTTGGQAYPWRIPCRFHQRAGFVALDQVRTVDRERLLKRIGRLAPATVESVLDGLQTMFAE